MFSHKVNFEKQSDDIVFMRALYQHLSGREKIIQGYYVYFNYNVKKDSNFLAEWDLLGFVEVNV